MINCKELKENNAGFEKRNQGWGKEKRKSEKGRGNGPE